VTIIPEQRKVTDFLALFLGGLFLLAAWRGAENEPVIAAILATIGAVVLGYWIYFRMKPRFALTIGPYEIVYGQPNRRVTVISRAATARLLIKMDTNYGWLLLAYDGDEQVQELVSLLAFDIVAVADACEANGWPVTMDPPMP
jgi:hypothetical protein